MVKKKKGRSNNMKITQEITEAVESLNGEQLDKLLKFVKVLDAGGTKEEAFAAAEGVK